MNGQAWELNSQYDTRKNAGKVSLVCVVQSCHAWMYGGRKFKQARGKSLGSGERDVCQETLRKSDDYS